MPGTLQEPFTPETARQAGIRSGEVRRANRAILKGRTPPPPINPPEKILEAETDAFTRDLSRACKEALRSLRLAIKEDKAQAVSQWARALRDLRETWHMATGKPKPGMTRPVQESSAAQRFRTMPRVQPTIPSAPLPELAPTTGSVQGQLGPVAPSPTETPSL